MSGYWSNLISKINIFSNDKQPSSSSSSYHHHHALRTNKRTKNLGAVPPLTSHLVYTSTSNSHYNVLHTGRNQKGGGGGSNAPHSPRGLIKPLNKITATSTLANTKATFKDNWIFEDVDDDMAEFETITFEDIEEHANLENQIYSNVKIFKEQINTKTIQSKWNHKQDDIDPLWIREVKLS
jgi:hypothetical protein